MAITKIKPIKSTIKKAIDYIANADKTNEQLLITTYGCSLETADLEFSMTQKLAMQNIMEKGNNLGFHLVQSFAKGEISDPDLAHEIGKQLADEMLKGKYEYVLTTHIDKGHIHNHLVFNATSFSTQHKYISNKKTYHRIRKISDRICADHGLSVIPETKNQGKSYKEYSEYKRGTSWKGKLKYAMDKAIWSSTTFDEFLIKMREADYEVRTGKHIAFRAPEQTNFTNAKTIGSYYTEENILLRLEKNRHKALTPKVIRKEIRLFVEVKKYAEQGNSTGYERWAKLNNLKEAAKSFNYLSENNLLNFEDFQQKIQDVDQALLTAEQELKQASSQLARQQLIQKHAGNYRQCKKIVDTGRTVSSLKTYKQKYAGEYQLYNSSKNALLEMGIKKIPSTEKLLTQIESLEATLAAIKHEQQVLQKEKKTLDIVSANIAILESADLPNKDAPALAYDLTSH